jgi:hypothetical protein
VDVGLYQFTEYVVNHSVPFQARFAAEFLGDDRNVKMAPAVLRARMACM